MKIYFKIIFTLILLYMLYNIGMSLELILILGAISLAIIFSKDKIKKTIDEIMHNHIPGFKGQHPWVKKIILFVMIIILLLIVKQILYIILAYAGYDVQLQIANSIENITKK